MWLHVGNMAVPVMKPVVNVVMCMRLARRIVRRSYMLVMLSWLRRVCAPLRNIATATLNSSFHDERQNFGTLRRRC